MTQRHQDPEVIVIGAGFSGLITGIELQKAGRSFVIIEKGDRVGGTWRDNTYPGAACDIPSHLYSIAEEPNPDWTMAYSEQPEILSYLEDVARRRGLLPHIRFGHALEEAVWDEAGAVWRVRAGGASFAAPVLVLGTGGLHIPNIPALPGMETYRGVAFHSAEWNHDFDLTGKRVAVVGTGASAIQFVPRIAPKVAQLDLYQRTPPWIIPKFDGRIPEWRRRLYRSVPRLRELARGGLFAVHEARHRAFSGDAVALRFAEGMARRHLKAQVPDPALRAKLTPSYRIGCKRVLLSNDYYPTLGRENVSLVTDGIETVTAEGIRTRDGTLRPADAIIYGTGFHATDAFERLNVTGRDGLALRDAWKGGMHAAFGTCTAGFPNMFVLLGPNTALGHNSVVLMIEAQVHFMMARLGEMRSRGIAAIEVTPEAERAFIAEVDARLGTTVWNIGGCRSWYIDASGRNTTLWPGTVAEFQKRLRRASLEGFVTRPMARQAA